MSQNSQNIALVGNPNCGKTSLFNILTGLNQKVGNFPGVTVDKKSGELQLTDGSKVNVIDLPGTYSLSPQSPDEQVVLDVLLNDKDENHPDLVVIVLDASNLKRNLFLATQILDLGFNAIIALNVLDVAERKGIKINTKQLEASLKAPVVEINAKKNIGIDNLISKIEKNPKYSGFDSRSIPEIDDELIKGFNELEQEQSKVFRIAINQDKINWTNDYENLNKIALNTLSINEINNRYRFVNKLIKDILSFDKKSDKLSPFTSKLDKIITHKIYGVFIFLFIFYLIFQSVFTIADYPMNWIDDGFGILTSYLNASLSENLFTSFLVDGVIAGLAGILVFVPQIMILFGLINILEETGYMARVSFINDRILKSVGMNGRSVVPLVGGFACAVPSIMAARSIENWKERLITIMVTPLMSCSARLPIYIFLVAFIVPEDYLFGFISLQGLFMLGLYLLGIIVSVIVAFILNKIITSKLTTSFLMELPNYRIPRWKNVGFTMLNKGKTFVWEAGKIILMISVVLWFLASFGPGDSFQEVENKYASELYQDWSEDVKIKEIQAEQLQVSYAGQIGRFIEPVIEPLGFDWKIGIALLSSFAAREVFVGTMSTIYSVGGGEDNIAGLQKKLMQEVNAKTGKPLMNLPTAFSLLIFYVFAMQCMSTLAIIKRETNSWKWPIISFVYLSGIAYLGSLITYQILI